MPDNYQDYIIPDNPLIQRASQNIRFKKWKTEPRLTIYYNNTLFHPIYQQDDARYYNITGQLTRPQYSNYEDYSSDFWMNPDYYVAHGFTGDCEDYALFMASVLENKHIPYRVVLGGYRGQRHAWVEFTFDNLTYITDSGFHPNADISSEYTPWYWFNKTMPITKVI
jgi:hypothetical protein